MVVSGKCESDNIMFDAFVFVFLYFAIPIKYVWSYTQGGGGGEGCSVHFFRNTSTRNTD